jgi:NNP family nitrate/nitrite transporter-like MFS transporter
VVGAAGGLGGFIPPLLMGAVFDWTNSYAVGFLMLAMVAAGAALYAGIVMRPRGSRVTSVLPVARVH